MDRQGSLQFVGVHRLWRWLRGTAAFTPAPHLAEAIAGIEYDHDRSIKKIKRYNDALDDPTQFIEKQFIEKARRAQRQRLQAIAQEAQAPDALDDLMQSLRGHDARSSGKRLSRKSWNAKARLSESGMISS